MQRVELITIGSDPELFLEDQKGKVISAIGKIGGTKDKPRPIKVLGKGFAVQEDNVLLEYNTPPAKSIATWVGFQRDMREYLFEMVGKLGLKLSNKASHSMSTDQMNHPNAFVMGCDPDYNVWQMKWNAKPKCDDPLLRSAGGHIHVCYTNPNQADSVRLGRLLDFMVGAPLARLDPDKKRRLLYGKPGAIRFKPYGLEYRTPSNFWTLDQKRVEAVYYNVQEACHLLRNYDNYSIICESAKQFLAGETEDWEDFDHFKARGVMYETGVNGLKPRRFNASADLDFIAALKMAHKPTVSSVSTDDWLAVEPSENQEINMDEDEDEGQ